MIVATPCDASGSVVVNGVKYDALNWDGELVVEAYSYPMLVLFHQMGAELEKLFPRAVAVEEACESEDTAPCPLEVRGGRIGAGEARSRSEEEHSLQSIPRTAAEK